LGNKLAIRLKGLKGTKKNLGSKKIQKLPTKPNQKCQIGLKNIKEGGGNKVGRKAFKQNIERRSQKLLGHP
jgi:hypothetical protein